MSNERIGNSLACALLGIDPRQCDPNSVWATRDLVAPGLSSTKGSGGDAAKSNGEPESNIYRTTILSALQGSDCAVRPWCSVSPSSTMSRLLCGSNKFLGLSVHPFPFGPIHPGRRP